MRFGQLIEYTREIFFKNHAESETGRLVPELFLFFKKALHEVKANSLYLIFNIYCISIALDLDIIIKTNCIKL